MAYSPIYEMVTLFGSSAKKPGSPKTRLKFTRSCNPERLKELASKADLTFEEFQELSSIDKGSVHIAKVIGYHVTTVYQMKITGKTRKYWAKYKEASK